MSDKTASSRCLVVDEHPVVRQGVRALLEQGFDEVELLDAPSAEAALDERRRAQARRRS